MSPTSSRTQGASPHTNGNGTSRPTEPGTPGVMIDCKLDQVYYGGFLAVRDSHVVVERGKITGFIGPSGCGKSTVLRSLNRMNDLIRGFRFEGHVHFQGKDVYSRNVDPVAVRRYIGMVFQQPNPFSMSIFDNVAFGLRLNRFKGDVAARVEQALRQAALWDEVKDKLKNSGLSLSGGHRALGAPDGRALLRPRPHRHPAHRGADDPAQAGLYDRHRHPQHAAGPA